MLILREKLQKKLEKSTDERILIAKKANGVQYYLRINSKDKNGTYLQKSDISKIRRLVQKQYDEKVLKEINKELSILKRLIHSDQIKEDHIKQIYSNYPKEVKEYINPIDCSDEDYKNQWSSIPFTPKPIGVKSDLITDNKEIVRSKSELNIANALNKYGISYRYECPLKLKNGYVIYPDFTVLNIKMRKEIYWEHRGMMDDREYAKHTVKRIKDYSESGYFLGDDLIITEEYSNEQLGTVEINRIIQHYFL